MNVRWSDATKLLESAVAIDPTFAEAYLRLAIVSGAPGNINARRKYLDLAARHADRLSERQRLLLELHVARDRDDAATATRLLDQMLAKFPDMEEGYTVATHIYRPAYVPPSHRVGCCDHLAVVTALPSASLSAQLGYRFSMPTVAEPSPIRESTHRAARPNPSTAWLVLRMAMREKRRTYTRALAIDSDVRAVLTAARGASASLGERRGRRRSWNRRI